MDAVGGILEQTEQEGGKHKTEVVTEFGVDKVSHILGVYGLLGTSAVFMLQGAIQEMIVCIPTKASADERRFESSVFTFVNQYCWMAEAHITKDRNASAGHVNWFEKDLVDSRETIDFLPKYLLLFGLLFLIPRFYWDHQVGGTLQSYLKYMADLIDIIKFNLSNVAKEGLYGGDKIQLATSFDQDSLMFNQDSVYKKITSDDFCLSPEKEPTTQELNDEFDLELESEAGDEEKGCHLLECVESGARKVINRPKLEKPRQKCLTDRDLFSLLCYKNFAHLPSIPFIQSMQRVTVLKGVHESRIEQMLAKKEPFSAGALFCLVKLWSNEKNMGGHQLWKFYLIRLIMNVSICIAITVFYYYMGYLSIMFGRVEVMEEFMCSVNFGTFGDNIDLLCKAPTAGDIRSFLIATTSIVCIIYICNILQIIKLYVFPNSETMGAKFLSFTLDDPLSYCQFWDPGNRNALTKATMDENQN